MQKKYLSVVVEIDDTYDDVHELMKNESVIINHWRGLVPPHRVEYIIGPLSDLGISNWNMGFDNIGCKYHSNVLTQERVKNILFK